MKAQIARKSSRKVDDRLRVQRLVESMFDCYYAERDKPLLNQTQGRITMGDVAEPKSLMTFGIFRVSLKDIATSLNLKNTKSNRLPYLIQDVLTGMDFCQHYGNWIFAEHEMDAWNFVELPEDSSLIMRIVPSPMEGKLHYGKHSVAAETCLMRSEWLDEEEYDEDEISEEELVEVSTGILIETYLNYLKQCPEWTNYKLTEYAQKHHLPVTSGRHTAPEMFSAVYDNIISVLIGHTHSSRFNVATRRAMFHQWNRLLVEGDVLTRRGETWTVTEPSQGGELVVENEAKGTRRVTPNLFRSFQLEEEVA